MGKSLVINGRRTLASFKLNTLKGEIHVCCGHGLHCISLRLIPFSILCSFISFDIFNSDIGYSWNISNSPICSPLFGWQWCAWCSWSEEVLLSEDAAGPCRPHWEVAELCTPGEMMDTTTTYKNHMAYLWTSPGCLPVRQCTLMDWHPRDYFHTWFES